VVFEDSSAGLKAATRAGMRTVFVPDLIAPSDALTPFVWRRVASLADAASATFYADM
jgi:beta-phosphoglucomutase-like phosphatase (HAD superfamily)